MENKAIEKTVGRRKPAPSAIKINPKDYTSERERLVAMYAPECIHKQEKMRVGSKDVPIGKHINEFTAFFGDPKIPVDQYRDLGYEPVIVDGRHICHKRDPLYRRPMSALIEQQTETEQQSADVVEQSMKGEDSVAKSVGLVQVPDQV